MSKILNFADKDIFVINCKLKPSSVNTLNEKDIQAFLLLIITTVLRRLKAFHKKMILIKNRKPFESSSSACVL